MRKRFGQPVSQLYEWSAFSADLDWSGPTPVTTYVPGMWIPQIDELPPAAEEVRDLIFVSNNDIARAPAVFDVDRFIDFIAVETVSGEGDGYVAGLNGDRSDNLFLYRPPTTGKFMFLVWDKDQGFWRPQTNITHAFENRRLTRELILWNPANLARYRQALRELIAGPHATANLHARVDAIFSQIRDAGLEDPVKPYSDQTFVAEVAALKAYISARNQAFLSQLGAP